MDLENSIKNKLNQLKPTVTTVYSSSGEVVKETKDAAGNLCVTKVDVPSAGYVIDNTPDLSVSRILPWLSMGSQDVVHDYDLLKSNGITQVLSIGIPSPRYEDIRTTFLEAYDLEEFRIIDIFEKCNRVINSTREQNGQVFVHCNAGVSRSATIVAAYLIHLHKISHTDALDTVKQERPKVNPNKGFIKQLEEYASQINRRTVS